MEGPNIRFIPQADFARVYASDLGKSEKLPLLADMCRVNTIAAVKRAGIGHLGTSFSAMDIFIWLYYRELNVLREGWDSPNRDIFFSSKGHDAPGLYSVLHSLGQISFEKLLLFRRLGGLDGHPDVNIPGMEANTGSLGMGISKAKGMAWAKRYLGRSGRVLVMTGDGELQEGQIFESLQTTAHQKITNVTAIVDHNKVQSNNLVEDIISLGDIEKKVRDFGWHVVRCDGHDYAELERVFAEFSRLNDKPKMLIADTIKGKGVSFMEHPAAFAKDGYYKWHAGAPPDEEFNLAIDELIRNVDQRIERARLARIDYIDKSPGPKKKSGVSSEFVTYAFRDALIEVARERKDVILMDADLSGDAKLELFAEAFPDRFIQNGIAEQDMVSMAGGLARQGLLPVVNSFSSFLAARGNEQIYNNATENSKIIYVCLFAGLIPAGPGKSHQSLRDIALLATLPNMTILHPSNAAETMAAVRYCIHDETQNCAIRLNIGPSPRQVDFGADYRLIPGRGNVVHEGKDAAIFAYGPVMLNEALTAAEILATRRFSLRVINLPWINRFDRSWIREVVQDVRHLYFLEDHGSFGGQGDHMTPVLLDLDLLRDRKVHRLGIDTFPACGTPPEVLRYHKLDGESLADRIGAAGREIDLPASRAVPSVERIGAE